MAGANGQKRAKTDESELDDLGRKILELEIAHPGASTRDLIVMGGLRCDRKTVDQRRRLVAYQKALAETRKDALKLLTDLESLAILTLQGLLDSSNPSIRLRAAHALATGTMEHRKEQIRRQYDMASHGESREPETVQVTLDYTGLDEKCLSENNFPKSYSFKK